MTILGYPKSVILGLTRISRGLGLHLFDPNIKSKKVVFDTLRGQNPGPGPGPETLFDPLLTGLARMATCGSVCVIMYPDWALIYGVLTTYGGTCPEGQKGVKKGSFLAILGYPKRWVVSSGPTFN